MNDINKKITIQERFTFTLNYIKNFMFIITPLTGLMIYIGTLVIEDSDTYQRIEAVVKWYEEKSNSFAVGLRVNKMKNDDNKTYYKVVYRSTDGHIYPAVYNKRAHHWFYLNDEGKTKECH